MLGASFEDGVTRFRVATSAADAAIVLEGGRVIPLARGADGVFEARASDVAPGARYRLRVGDRTIPDPFARFLPEGVHGPAEVIAPLARPVVRRPLPLDRPRAIYELHVGTFTPEGTYDAARARLDHVAELGVDAIELMPIAAFAGARGWGYDGVALLAPHAPYGRPEDLARLVDDAHARGLAVIVDVVLNHLGPAGNHLAALDPATFDHAAPTPWGDAPAFAHPTMRALARQVITQWIAEYGFDGVRLDATHAIASPGDPPILEDLVALARTLPGPPVLIAEDERRDPALLSELGLDGLWADDFHHAVHVLLTGEREGYYAPYEPTLETLARAIRDGWIGPSLGSIARARLLYCLENHDQVGNRAIGERLSHLVGDDALRAAILLLACVPASVLLFQGQEWAASTPFLYATDHEPELGAKVSRGRREEFSAFSAFADPAARARIPDPQDPETHARSILRWDERAREPHASILALHRRVLALRRTHPVLSSAEATLGVDVRDGRLEVTRRLGASGCRFVWAPSGAVDAHGARILASAPRAVLTEI